MRKWIIIHFNTMHGNVCIGNQFGFYLEVVHLKQEFCLSLLQVIKLKAKSALCRLSSTLTKERRLSDFCR